SLDRADRGTSVVHPPVTIVVGGIRALRLGGADRRAAVVRPPVTVVVSRVGATREVGDVDVVQVAGGADDAAVHGGGPVYVRIRVAGRDRVLRVAAAVDVEPKRDGRDSGRPVPEDHLYIYGL